MAVAKSYIGLPIVEEPYESNGRMYCKVRKKNGNIQQVRWYTDAEFRKLYPEEVQSTRIKSQKEVFGFDKGYITLLRTNDIDWLEWSNARFATFFGWYLISTEELLDYQPEDLTCHTLLWETVGDEHGQLFNKQKIAAAVDAALYSQHNDSVWVGAVGDRLELKVEVIAAQCYESKYGTTTVHTFKDEAGNLFDWTTTAKCWSVGEKKILRGTVKEHIKSQIGDKTILTRCMEVRF